MRRISLTLACLLLALVTRPLAADNPPRPSNLRSDILYTTKGEFVQVSPMHPLTLNAHVEQFCYDPLGLEIAYVGSETIGDTTTHFVKTIDARTGHELSRLTMTAPQDDRNTRFALLGWSISGKYLLLQRSTPGSKDEDTAITEFLRWNLSITPPVVRLIRPEMQSEAAAEAGFASSDRHWLLLKFPGGPYLLYDPELDTLRALALPIGAITFEWSDAGHLSIWQDHLNKRFDVVTGKISPRTVLTNTDLPAASKHYPDLTLNTEFRELDDVQGSGGYLNSSIIWIRRIPATKQPLGAVAAGLLPVNNDPQAVWSPTGKQVGFIANSELCVSDLTNSADLLPHEKMAVGVKLTCPEEQALALSDLKQIGLGITQYAQDYDEHFPAATGFTNTIYPYIKSTDVFSVGSHSFVYEQPKDLSLAKMEDPAHTEMGYMDLPCARVVLMGDGHVRSLRKTENGEQE